MLSHRPQVFKLLASIMTDPSDEVRSAISFIFLQLYSAEFKANEEVFIVLDTLIAKGILNILKNGLAKDAVKHALALLKVFIQRDSKRIGLFFEIANGELSFVKVIKKILVSSEPAFQVAIVQCLCHILSFPSSTDHHVQILIDGNVPELLFEVASSKNELLLETVLCCLTLFSKFKTFCEKCQVMYGLTTILDVTTHMFKIRNMRLFNVALNLLTSLISSDQYILAAPLQNSFLLQALDMVECSFKLQSPQVIPAICRFFSLLLKKESSSLPTEVSKLDSILQICLKSIQKFFLSQQSTSSSHKKNYNNKSIDENILICGLNIIHYFIKVTKPCSESLVSEEIFSCPIVERDDSSLKSNKKQNLKHIFETCILALENIFLPHCLFFNSDLEFKKIAWYHLTNVLHVIYEEPFEDEILSNFSQILIKAKLLNYVWDLKIFDVQIDKCTDITNVCSSQDLCNSFVKNFLCFLSKKDISEEYVSALESGLLFLDGSLESSISLLSKKSAPYDSTSESMLHSAQIAFLSLCYFSYLNEAPIVKPKAIIPHLIYFVTCNSNSLSTCRVVMKHIIFLLAKCSYLNLKEFQSGLMEVNGLVWDALSKLNSFVEVYTHHKVVLWWCFQNTDFYSFGSFVLQTWLEFILHITNSSVSPLALTYVQDLLCSNETAQETFVKLYDEQQVLIFSFLKQAFNFNVSKENNKDKLNRLLLCLIQYIHSTLSKVLIMKDCGDAMSESSFISIGLECLLWCYENLHDIYLGIDIKLVLQILKLCCSCKFEGKACLHFLKYLQFAVRDSSENSKAWYIITGNSNISSFFLKCFSLKDQIESEALCLLQCILEKQVDLQLKSSSCLKITFLNLFGWLNNMSTQLPALYILSCALKTGFTDIFLSIHSADMSTYSSELSSSDLRLLTFYLQNALAVGNPATENIVLSNYLKLLDYISETDPILENHIMLQPWSKVLLESKLDRFYDFLELFERHCDFHKENITLREIMDRLAEKITNLENVPDRLDKTIRKLITGVYKSYISKENIENLSKLLISESQDPSLMTVEKDVISEVESLVNNYRSNEITEIR